jgi:hypothetical protein
MLSFGRVKALRSCREMSFALRALSALVVWLSLGGQLGGLAHFALISHHVCATHGELAHGEDHAHAPSAAGVEPAAERSDALISALDAEEAHDDCSVLGRLKEQPAPTGGTAATLAPATLPTPATARLDAPSFRDDAVLALAPKTSPPA